MPPARDSRRHMVLVQHSKTSPLRILVGNCRPPPAPPSWCGLNLSTVHSPAVVILDPLRAQERTSDPYYHGARSRLPPRSRIALEVLATYFQNISFSKRSHTSLLHHYYISTQMYSSKLLSASGDVWLRSMTAGSSCSADGIFGARPDARPSSALPLKLGDWHILLGRDLLCQTRCATLLSTATARPRPYF
jgi:hypothetical protein